MQDDLKDPLVNKLLSYRLAAKVLENQEKLDKKKRLFLDSFLAQVEDELLEAASKGYKYKEFLLGNYTDDIRGTISLVPETYQNLRFSITYSLDNRHNTVISKTLICVEWS